MPQKARVKEIRFSVIVPIYNEEKNLPRIIDEINSVFVHFDESYEIIFIDDGSVDSSFQILRKYASQNPRIRIIQFIKPYNAALCQSR